MVRLHTLKIQRVSLYRVIYLLFLLFFFCPKIWASQEAMVIVDRAVIYSDQEMSSPLGYVRKGKKITVGEIPRNHAQVYPIVVSGRIGYIRVLDVTTERASMESEQLVAERFQQSARRKLKTKFVVSYFHYNSQISLAKDNGKTVDKELVNWNGISLKGEVLVSKNWDFGILVNYMQANQKGETFRAVEVGFSGAYRLINARSFLLRVEGQLLPIPFSNYSVGNDFRVNSYGFSSGAGLNALYLFDENWGVEAFGGVYYTKLFNFKAPAPYNSISPSFYGNRIGIGINYTY